MSGWNVSPLYFVTIVFLGSAGLALIGWLVRHGFASNADLIIRYRPGKPVELRGRLAGARKGAILEFLKRDLNPDRPLTVLAWKRSPKPWVLKVKGDLSAFQRQRIRNVVLDSLGK